jgi:hypothetical protein
MLCALSKALGSEVGGCNPLSMDGKVSGQAGVAPELPKNPEVVFF